MTATTTTKYAYKSGFCTTGAADWSHARCSRTYGHPPFEATCTCSCHDEPVRTINDDIETLAEIDDDEDRAVDGREHDLIVHYGDCEFIASCRCGVDLGTYRPDKAPEQQSFARWERHVMLEVPHA